MRYRIEYFLLLLCVWFAGCQRQPMAWDGPQLTQPRTQLTVAALCEGAAQPLLDMSFFARPLWASTAIVPFSGTIVLPETLLTFPKQKAYYPGENLFPALRLDFVTAPDGALIPLQKGRIDTRAAGESYWDVIVGAGRVWQEVEDADWSRASFPFTLTDRWVGQARNCVATFVYQEDTMSRLCFQCSQETADIDDQQLGDMYAMLPASYEPAAFGAAADVVAAYRATAAGRLPVQPLTAIDAHQELSDYFERPKQTRAPTSMGAVWLDGQLYVHPPSTRHGIYPYPEEMRHGLYSVTKSMAGALALMHLEARYPESVFDLKITDYVPALAQHPGWQGVTFGQTLNMATGVDGGEDAARLFHTLIVAETAEQAIQHIATLQDDPHTPPGQRFHYATTNLFVLSYAMQQFVAQKEGAGVNYWDLVRQAVLVPIGAPYFEVLHTQEADSVQAIPMLGFGALPTLDEAAKIALLFAEEGQHNGQSLLDAQRVREAMGRTTWGGYPTQGDARGDAYRHSFWAKTFRGQGCEYAATFMLGFGENYVVYLPSGAILFRFYDEHDLDLRPLLQRLDRLAPSCE